VKEEKGGNGRGEEKGGKGEGKESK